MPSLGGGGPAGGSDIGGGSAGSHGGGYGGRPDMSDLGKDYGLNTGGWKGLGMGIPTSYGAKTIATPHGLLGDMPDSAFTGPVKRFGETLAYPGVDVFSNLPEEKRARTLALIAKDTRGLKNQHDIVNDVFDTYTLDMPDGLLGAGKRWGLATNAYYQSMSPALRTSLNMLPTGIGGMANVGAVLGGLGAALTGNFMFDFDDVKEFNPESGGLMDGVEKPLENTAVANLSDNTKTNLGIKQGLMGITSSDHPYETALENLKEKYSWIT